MTSWQRSITPHTNDYKIFVYFIPFISHNQHHLEHFHDATYVPNNQNELLPLAQARVHMHWQEDNSHPASPRILTRKSQTKKKRNFKQISLHLHPSGGVESRTHALTQSSDGLVVCSPSTHLVFKFSSVKPYPPESPRADPASSPEESAGRLHQAARRGGGGRGGTGRVRAGWGRRRHGGAGDGDGEAGARGAVPPPGWWHPHRRRPLAPGVSAHARCLAGVPTLLHSIRPLRVAALSWVRTGSCV